MIKALKVFFMFIVGIQVMNIKLIIYKFRLRRLNKLFEIGYLDKNQTIKIAERLENKIIDASEVYKRKIEKCLK